MTSAPPSLDVHLVVGSGFCAPLRGIYRPCLSVDDGIVHAILYVRALVPGAVESDVIGLVLSEQQWDLALAIEVIIVQRQVGMVRVDYAESWALVRVQDRLRVAIRPGPSVAEPQGRQYVQQGPPQAPDCGY